MSWLIVYGKFVGKYYLDSFHLFSPQKQQQQPQPPNPPHLNAGSLLEVIRILDLPDPKRDFGFLALLMASQPGLPSQKKVPETPRNRKAL